MKAARPTAGATPPEPACPGFLGRVNSSSYVIHGVEDRTGFEEALRDLFDAHAVNGEVAFRYRTWLELWRFKPL